MGRMSIGSRWLWAVMIHAVLHSAAATAFRVMISFQAIGAGFDAGALGLLAASFAVPPLFAAFHAGRWTDRFAGVVPIAIGDVTVLVAIALPLLSSQPLVLVLAGGLFGLGSLLCLVGLQTYVGVAVPPSGLERAYGNMFASNSVGQMIGPLLATGIATVAGGFVGSAGLNIHAGLLATLGLAVLGLAIVPLMRGPKVVAPPRHEELSSFAAIGVVLGTRGSGPIIVINAVAVAIIDMLSVFLPAWGVERQIAPAAIGGLLSLRSAASIVVRFGMGWLIATIGRRNLLLGSSLAIGAALALLPWASLEVAAGLVVILGMSLGLSPPISLAWLSLYVPTNVRGSAMGLRITINRFAQAALPAGIGLISPGTTVVFLCSAGLAAATAFLLGGIPLSGPPPNNPPPTPPPEDPAATV